MNKLINLDMNSDVHFCCYFYCCCVLSLSLHYHNDVESDHRTQKHRDGEKDCAKF